MAQIREIKKRRGAVKTIARITKTMQMIATAKFTAAVQRANATRPYADKVRQLVEEVSEAAIDISNPLLEPPAEDPHRSLLLVITSDRGMCGAYNSHILRTGIQRVRSQRGVNSKVDVETAGKKAVAFFNFQKINTTRKHAFGDKPSYEVIARLASRYIDLYEKGKYASIDIAYMRFETNTRQVPQIMQLLPLSKPEQKETEPESKGSTALYDFSPSSEALLADLLPLAVKTNLYQAFNDAVVSEHIMRMVAMKAATENANDLGRNLGRQFNRARQSQITTELTEIISGAAALE